jgi:hypothetical protein
VPAFNCYLKYRIAVCFTSSYWQIDEFSGAGWRNHSVKLLTIRCHTAVRCGRVIHARAFLIVVATIVGMAGAQPWPPVPLLVDNRILVPGVNAICDWFSCPVPDFESIFSARLTALSGDMLRLFVLTGRPDSPM